MNTEFKYLYLAMILLYPADFQIRLGLLQIHHYFRLDFVMLEMYLDLNFVLELSIFGW